MTEPPVLNSEVTRELVYTLCLSRFNFQPSPVKPNDPPITMESSESSGNSSVRGVCADVVTFCVLLDRRRI